MFYFYRNVIDLGIVVEQMVPHLAISNKIGLKWAKARFRLKILLITHIAMQIANHPCFKANLLNFDQAHEISFLCHFHFLFFLKHLRTYRRFFLFHFNLQFLFLEPVYQIVCRDPDV